MEVTRKEARAIKRYVENKFKRIHALREAGAHMAVKHMSDSWMKRTATDPGALYKPGKAAPCIITRAHHV